MMHSVDRAWVGALVVVVAVVVGCTDPLQHSLEEPEANAMVVTLNNHGVDARKVEDPSDDDRWAVQVPEDQRVRAWTVLEREGFPRPEPAGFDEFYPGGGLIPTANEERVILQHATAEQLRASLLGIDGIVEANVHLVLPEQPRVQMSGDDISRPRASVLVQWQQGRETPPLDRQEVRRLISGAVDDLQPDAVHVVMTPVAKPEPVLSADEPRYTRVGPIAVAPESQGLLRGVVLLMGVVIIALSGGLVYVLLTRENTGGES